MAPETGEGGSKREAEQDAAAKLLARVGAMTTRCGFCAIIGAPNAGKSTLDQCPGGIEGGDCQPQGSDHPHDRARAWR